MYIDRNQNVSTKETRPGISYFTQCTKCLILKNIPALVNIPNCDHLTLKEQPSAEEIYFKLETTGLDKKS